MKKLLLCLFIYLGAALQPALASATDEAELALPPDPPAAIEPATEEGPDSRQMEKDLQQLPWKQARSIIESVPKLKASVDAYGPLGWQFVEANYQHYRWKKNIDKLDTLKKKELAELIHKAQTTR